MSLPQEVTALRVKAQRSLKAAQYLLSYGDSDFAVSRLYYAIFYMTEALLLSRGLSFSSHSAVLSAFYEHFVKSGLIAKECHQLLHEVFDRRQEADYDASMVVSREEVELLIGRAGDFMVRITPLLER